MVEITGNIYFKGIYFKGGQNNKIDGPRTIRNKDKSLIDNIRFDKKILDRIKIDCKDGNYWLLFNLDL